MPKLVALYIRQVAIGFGLSAVFVAALLWFDIAGLGHLISSMSEGPLAVAMLFMANGIVFAGVQFAITILRMGQDDDEPKGGRRAPERVLEPALVPALVPVPVPVEAPRR
ncbi:MAG: hypothetical protein D6811_00725 [Alphaproteobacteria bacterium]|nr:MAG: hypothetical protein D6811_00725 [Alphaproteobacteria bacterium]